STCTLASRHGTIFPSNQITPSRSAIDITTSSISVSICSSAAGAVACPWVLPDHARRISRCSRIRRVRQPMVPESDDVMSVVMKLVARYFPRLLLQCQAVGCCPVGLVSLLQLLNVFAGDQSGVAQPVQYSDVVRVTQ